MSKYSKKHYSHRKEYYLEKATRNRKIARYKLRRFVFDHYKTHPCVECGENNPIVLEFDHLKEKYKGIAIMVNRALSLKRMQAEIEKCEVVYANCHRRRTARQLHWYEDLL